MFENWKLQCLCYQNQAANHILCTLKMQLWSLSLSPPVPLSLILSFSPSLLSHWWIKPQNSNMRAPTHPYTHTHIYVKWHLLARWMKRWIRCIHISEARTNHVSSSPQYLNTIRGVKRLHRKCQTVQSLKNLTVPRTCEIFRKETPLMLQREEDNFMMF